MNEYPFKRLKSFAAGQGDALYEQLQRDRFQRLDLPEFAKEGRDRGFGGIPGGSIPPPPGGILPPPPPGPSPGPGPAPGGSSADPLFVTANTSGGITLAFNFQGATAGGGGNNEIRVSPYLPYDWAQTKSIFIMPVSGVTAGQFLQTLRADDDDITNSAFPTGTKLGSQVGRVGSYPTPDNERGIAIPSQPVMIDSFRLGWNGGAYLKCRLYFVAPAVALPVISVLITIRYNASGLDLLSAGQG